MAAAKESTYAAIKELEFDYRAGSLSQEDYRDLESRYKRKAAALLQVEDARHSEADRRAQIEAEIRRLRGVPAQPPKQRQAAPPATGRFCTQCGSPSDPTDRFCANCGHPLSKAGSKA
ncbi:MAG: zinc ribbon domain-containing protein [Chloroflexi bacterium]|nr:zinc ribbon domain-containing protein [Chloroflexota bacterium]